MAPSGVGSARRPSGAGPDLPGTSQESVDSGGTAAAAPSGRCVAKADV